MKTTLILGCALAALGSIAHAQTAPSEYRELLRNVTQEMNPDRRLGNVASYYDDAVSNESGDPLIASYFYSMCNLMATEATAIDANFAQMTARTKTGSMTGATLRATCQTKYQQYATKNAARSFALQSVKETVTDTLPSAASVGAVTADHLRNINLDRMQVDVGRLFSLTDSAFFVDFAVRKFPDLAEEPLGASAEGSGTVRDVQQHTLALVRALNTRFQQLQQARRAEKDEEQDTVVKNLQTVYAFMTQHYTAGQKLDQAKKFKQAQDEYLYASTAFSIVVPVLPDKPDALLAYDQKRSVTLAGKTMTFADAVKTVYALRDKADQALRGAQSKQDDVDAANHTLAQKTLKGDRLRLVRTVGMPHEIVPLKPITGNKKDFAKVWLPAVKTALSWTYYPYMSGGVACRIEVFFKADKIMKVAATARPATAEAQYACNAVRDRY